MFKVEIYSLVSDVILLGEVISCCRSLQQRLLIVSLLKIVLLTEMTIMAALLSFGNMFSFRLSTNLRE